MSSSFKLFELCGTNGVTNKRLLQELQHFDVVLTRATLRERLARAVSLGYMCRHARRHSFVWRLCDRHALTLFAEPSSTITNYTNDFLSASTRLNIKHATTMTETLPFSDKIHQNVGEDNFLKECWKDWNTLIEGLGQKPILLQNRTEENPSGNNTTNYYLTSSGNNLDEQGMLSNENSCVQDNECEARNANDNSGRTEGVIQETISNAKRDTEVKKDARTEQEWEHGNGNEIVQEQDDKSGSVGNTLFDEDNLLDEYRIPGNAGNIKNKESENPF